jgi:hypothetical protein
MSTEKLIVDLASRGTPVRPLGSPAVRFSGWASVAVASAVAAVVFFGPRSNVSTLLGDPDFVVTALASSLTAVLAALGSLVLAIPGAARGRGLRIAALSALILWGLLIGAALARTGGGFANDSHWPICFARVLAVGAMPGLALLTMLRRAAPLDPVSTGALAGLAAAAVGAAVMPFVCPIDAPAHALRGHFAPVVIVVMVSAWIGPRVLRVAQSRP